MTLIFVPLLGIEPMPTKKDYGIIMHPLKVKTMRIHIMLDQDKVNTIPA